MKNRSHCSPHFEFKSILINSFMWCIKIAGRNSPRGQIDSNEKLTPNTLRIKEQAQEQLRSAMAEKSFAEDARRQARKQIELAEQELANAKRIRQQAQSELGRALALKEQATKQLNSTILQVNCHTYKQQFQARAAAGLLLPCENSPVLSYNTWNWSENREERLSW